MARMVRFPSTFWTRILSNPKKIRAEIYSRYRLPIFNFILNRGYQEEDAEDLTQEIFSRVCKEEFLGKADQKKGKFRTLLLAVTRNVLLDGKKRAGRRRAQSIEQGGKEGSLLDLPSKTKPDEHFERLWMENLIRIAFERLMAESSGDSPPYYESLILHKLEGLPHRKVAARLGAKEADIATWVHRAKARLKEHLLECVQAYSSRESEWREEWRLLRKHLR